MAKPGVMEFIRQVRQETSKVTWPSRRETIVSTGMVFVMVILAALFFFCLLYTSPSPRDKRQSRMPSSA